MKNFKKILIVRLDRIGDVLLSTPVIKAVRDACPDSYITLMVRPYARDVVEGNPYLNEVITYDKQGNERSLLGNLKFISELRKKQYDIAIILHPTGRSHIIAFLAGIPSRVGYHKKWGILLTRRIPHTKQFGLKHEIDYTLDILRYIGIGAKNRTMYMPVKAESDKKIKNIYAGAGIQSTDIVVALNPSASCASKRWRAENFADTADGLAQKYGARIVIISAPEDKSFGDDVAALMKKSALNLSGATSVGDLASVLKRANLFISNDSGPVHIACAVGTPVIAIFGRRDRGLAPQRWAPTGKNDIVLHKDVGCDICHAHNCKKGFKCLEAITVAEVSAAAERILREVRNGK